MTIQVINVDLATKLTMSKIKGERDTWRIVSIGLFSSIVLIFIGFVIGVYWTLTKTREFEEKQKKQSADFEKFCLKKIDNKKSKPGYTR